MKIQLISHKANFPEEEDFVLSTIRSPKSLDEFDINVIDISSSSLWYNRSDSVKSIRDISDFKSIRTMVWKKTKSKIVYVFPQNVEFHCDARIGSGNPSYMKSLLLKNIIDTVYQNIFLEILPLNTPVLSLIYENTRTAVNSLIYEADFYFDGEPQCVTKSDLSDKATTLQLTENDIFATTLDITRSKDALLNFLDFLFGTEPKSKAPDWLSAISFSNDAELRRIIENSHQVITAEQKKIEEAEVEISKNARYKSILYTNGDELVEVVFDILEKLLDCDLSGFIDKKKEDFLIKKTECTFIGEIKGITSNVKKANIAQVELHYQEYTDRLAENGLTEKVQPILIINPSRNKAPQQRDPIDDQQISLAKRNNCLIIETTTLLHIFEKFLSGKITSSKCIEIFSTHTGLLNETDFDNSTPEILEAYKG